jgi:hypothetical protein
MIVKYLNSGWDDDGFESKLQELIDKLSGIGLVYYDIKISSNGNNCMVIFKN